MDATRQNVLMQRSSNRLEESLTIAVDDFKLNIIMGTGNFMTWQWGIGDRNRHFDDLHHEVTDKTR